MITSTINVISTLPGIWGVDRLGRRPLLLWGATGMCVSQFLVAMLGTLTTSQNTNGDIIVHNVQAQKAGIAFICVYIFFFASTWGPLTWVVSGEIFPLKIRAKSLSINIATNWLLNWAIAYATPFLVNWGPENANLQSKIFFVWCGFCLFGIAFVYLFIYETKGLSLEEVDDLYAKVAHAKDSPGWQQGRTTMESQSFSKGVLDGSDNKVSSVHCDEKPVNTK